MTQKGAVYTAPFSIKSINTQHTSLPPNPFIPFSYDAHPTIPSSSLLSIRILSNSVRGVGVPRYS